MLGAIDRCQGDRTTRERPPRGTSWCGATRSRVRHGSRRRSDVIVSYRLFGMDVGFYNSIGVYPLETRCEMLADLGYDATNLTLWSDAAWSDLPKLGSAASSSGLSVACINVTVDLSAPTDRGETARILDMIERIEATDTVELA